MPKAPATPAPSDRPQKALIEKIEEIRQSRVLVYITGDRQPFPASIDEDVVRPMYDHLLALEKLEPRRNKRKKLDLFLYSRGGDVSVPWRLVSMFRQFCDELNVLIPYKAYSAATMISIGADKIVMGRKAELGPIDPTLVRFDPLNPASPPQEISVEDVLSYISFIKERANVNDQAALAHLVGMLSSSLAPLTLGQINRQNSHIRLVARKMLTSHSDKVDEEKLVAIVEALTEKLYYHGHAIGRTEAKEIGLPVEEASADLEAALWKLFEHYENELELRNALHQEILLKAEEEQKLEDFPIGILESSEKLHMLEIRVQLRKRRVVPPDPQVSVPLVINLPPGTDSQQLPQEVEKEIEKQVKQAVQKLGGLVRQEIEKQSPVAGADIRLIRGGWEEK